MSELFLTVLETSLSVSPIIVLMLFLSPLFDRRYAAKWSYLIWIFLAVRLLIPFDAEDGRAAMETLSKWRQQAAMQPAPQTTSEDGQDNQEILPEPGTPRIVVRIPAQITAPFAAKKSRVTPLIVIAYVWAAGCAVYLVINSGSYLHYKRKVLKYGTVWKDRAALEQLIRIRRELKIQRNVTVVSFPEAGSPMLIGYLRPILIINGGVSDKLSTSESFSERELYFILKHELVHCKRGDLYVKFLFMAVCALHWFNPLVWLMQKNAAVTMELSCDEHVIKGMPPEQKKVYTETLLSTLHKGGARSAMLSTDFFEGKKVMKKRFQNILRKHRKKNGFYLLAGIAILTLGMGTLVGCSVIGEKTEAGETTQADANAAQKADDLRSDIYGTGSAAGANNSVGNTVAEAEGNTTKADDNAENTVAGADNSAENNTADTITLTFMKEGMEEKKQAELVAEPEYMLYLPVGEWQKTETNMWQAGANEDVRLWVSDFPDRQQAEQLLTNNGYLPKDDGMEKEEDGMAYRVRLYETEGRVFCVFYRYPEEAEEGWGRELPVIADTFMVVVPGGQSSENDAADNAQILGYISRFGDGSVTIDRQNWVTPEDSDWKSEYDADAGFEIVDIEGEDVTYPLAGDCHYFVLENHQGERIEIDEAAFADYLRETDFPMFWAIEVSEGQVVGFAEWYRP